jgi:hypothetical protein
MEKVSLQSEKVQEDVTTDVQEVKLVDIPLTDENTALNLLIAFLAHAQKKGIYSFDESAKIWECIKMFQKNSPN